MQNIVTLIIGLLLTSGIMAQNEYKLAFQSRGNQRVEIYLQDADLTLEGYTGNEVKVMATGMKPLPERAKGLRPLRQGASDNTGMGLEVKRGENNRIIITQTQRTHLKCTVKIPQNANLYLQENQSRPREVVIQNCAGEIEIDGYGASLNLKNVKGPIVAKSTRGNINIVFASFSQDGPSSVISTKGFIDLTLPANTKANLELETISGEVYTDFEINMEEAKSEENEHKHKSGCCNCSSNQVVGTINGGGTNLFVKSVKDHIYLRKAKT